MNIYIPKIKAKLIEIISQIPFIKSYYNGLGVILMFHRVTYPSQNSLIANEILRVSPDFFKQFLLKLRDNRYSFISLESLYHILRSKNKPKQKFAVVTFDDGYKDNITIAYPILKEVGIPFTIYITTSFPNKVALLWWYIIEDIILTRSKINIWGKTFDCKSWENKNTTFYEVRNIVLNIPPQQMQTELTNMLQEYNIDWKNYAQNLCMNWEDIKYLSNDPLCTIGNHTTNHYNLAQLSKSEIEHEILEANTQLEKHTNRKIEHFAYPFGSPNEVTKRETNILKKMKFKTCVTTYHGTIYSHHINYLESLPRIMVTENLPTWYIHKIRKQRIVKI